MKIMRNHQIWWSKAWYQNGTLSHSWLKKLAPAQSYGGFLKLGKLQIIHSNRIFHEINHPAIEVSPILGNFTHPYGLSASAPAKHDANRGGDQHHDLRPKICEFSHLM